MLVAMHEVECTASAVNMTAPVTLRSVAWLWNAGNGCATPIYRRHAAGSGCTHARVGVSAWCLMGIRAGPPTHAQEVSN